MVRLSAASVVVCSLCLCATAPARFAVAPKAPSAAQEPAPARLLGDFEAGWEADWATEQLGGGETTFRVVSEAGGLALRADSEAAATAMFRTLDGSEAATRISWRWKVAKSLAGDGDETQREGDDYAARLFVVFGSERLSRNTRALCYVWAGNKAVGSTYRSPYFDTVHTIAVQSGDERAGIWMAESRDFVADYLRAFGEAPPAAGAVALMVDTDDTGGRATAWFDDIVISQ